MYLGLVCLGLACLAACLGLVFLESEYQGLVFQELVFQELVYPVWCLVRCSLRATRGCLRWCWLTDAGMATSSLHCPSCSLSPLGAGPAAAAKAAAKAAKYGKMGSLCCYPTGPAS